MTGLGPSEYWPDDPGDGDLSTLGLAILIVCAMAVLGAAALVLEAWLT